MVGVETAALGTIDMERPAAAEEAAGDEVEDEPNPRERGEVNFDEAEEKDEEEAKAAAGLAGMDTDDDEEEEDEDGVARVLLRSEFMTPPMRARISATVDDEVGEDKTVAEC